MISGPSGVGKDTLMEILEKRNPEKIHIAITATTRKPRSNEINGVNHFFVNRDKFNQMINNVIPNQKDRPKGEGKVYKSAR